MVVQHSYIVEVRTLADGREFEEKFQKRGRGRWYEI